MADTTADGEEYPPGIPLEDEPERFIEGSTVSNELERDAQKRTPDADDDGGADREDPSDDDFARVNDG
ncbi:MAG TPA: hypothetical protein VIJ18_08635 [Microbacteriaceae bacterium]